MTEPTVRLVSGPTEPGDIDNFELEHARRALARLKSLIGHQGLLDLLATDIAEGNAFLAEHARKSNGELRSATTVLTARGIKAVRFLKWLGAAFADETVLLAAEPEHWAIAPQPDGTVSVVENLGRYVVDLRLPAYDTASDAAPPAELLPEADFPYRRIADMRVSDGTVVGRMLTQFGDTDEGFTAYLTCYFPVSCPEEIFEHHRQHLAVEFRNWITAAAEGPA